MAEPALLFLHGRGRCCLPASAEDGLKIRCSRERGETRSKRAEKRARQKRCGGWRAARAATQFSKTVRSVWLRCAKKGNLFHPDAPSWASPESFQSSIALASLAPLSGHVAFIKKERQI